MVVCENSNSVKATLRRLSELDWDFPAQSSDSPFSSLHWHPCRFPSQIPAISIARLTSAGGNVLDPFMGSATTIVEAQRLGRRSVGIDVNPISALMASAKTLSIEAVNLERYVNSICLFIKSRWDQIPLADVPPTVQVHKWYTRTTALALCKLWSVTLGAEEAYSPIFKAAFSSILLSACREIRHWGYVCDNSEPKSDREVDVSALFCSALKKFSAAYMQRDADIHGEVCVAGVYNGRSQDILKGFSDEYFDCVVTSPPYFGVADYAKAQRLSMEWFSFDIEPVRLSEIGARSKRHRRSSLSEYVTELRAVLAETYRVMRFGAHAVIVFGQSPARRDSYEGFREALVDVGFVVDLEKTRQIPRTRRQKPSVLEEIVIVATKV